MSRAAALEFSFLVSMPVMAVATGYAFLKSFKGGANPLGATALDAHGLVVLAIGLVVSFVVAYASVAWLMAFVRRRGFAPFAIYRLIAGALVLGFLARLGR
jgi:undecaprenyl-diphosphatase